MGAGTKANQEELQCHHPEPTENHSIEHKDMVCLTLYLVSFVALVNYVQIEERSVEHVQALPCQK